MEVARVASPDPSKWAGASYVTLESGNFDGWVDEVAVRSNVQGSPSVPRTSEPPRIGSLKHAANGMLLEWTAPAGSQFQVQWKSALTSPAWTAFTNIVTATNSSSSFLDNGSQTGGLPSTRFYRLVQLQ